MSESINQSSKLAQPKDFHLKRNGTLLVDMDKGDSWFLF